ncbi:hypothetical protein GCG54_00006869 [Colletotrichum gloeosporioides]|uniref:Fungal N-terminal domain-containing protein n=1 Tax=Colletotrichum gloeosporioides TaxID=474922 RepID=A0A8H4FN51_COLGL|nr:uncharacterized protein GCG54_00006869 [Colletotrichum gloeosporioides]KAF3808250.1 hypothetical protein GCG54_00006869 [Colletotrichum gloeosporioides]
MAEVLGTVVGVVSLGLQVCSGLNVYIDGLQCRREEIESTIRHQKSLETLVAQIEALQNRCQAPGICSAPLQESMASAKAELLLLDEFINKVRIEGETGADRSVGEMMKIQKKRLLYPFRRDRLDRLVTRLDVVIKALQAALQVFEIEASLEMKNSFNQVLQTVSRSEVTMLAIERKIDESGSLAHEPDYATKQDVMELKTLMADLMSPSASSTLKHMTGDQIIGLCEDLETDWTLSRDEKSILLRVCTFKALPIRHTCCYHWEYARYSSDFSDFDWGYRLVEEEEVEEIREEDNNELALLENLLVEFESKIDEMGYPLATFFETYWIDRMREVLQEIQERTLLEDEVRGAERLGITLRVEEENRLEKKDYSQLEYWFHELNVIVA